MTEDEMVEWYHRLNGREFEQTLGDSEGQGSLECCSPWGRKELDMTQRLKNNNKEFQTIASADGDPHLPGMLVSFSLVIITTGIGDRCSMCIISLNPHIGK